VFSRDGGYAFAGDKFGDVAVASTADGASAPLLGHYCSTISSLALSPDGARICSCIRKAVSMLLSHASISLQIASEPCTPCVIFTYTLQAAAWRRQHPVILQQSCKDRVCQG